MKKSSKNSKGERVDQNGKLLAPHRKVVNTSWITTPANKVFISKKETPVVDDKWLEEPKQKPTVDEILKKYHINGK